MGKGFNNYMTKKFFHPASKDNIKRVWMAEQKTVFEKKKQEDLMNQYQKEQDMLSNRALLGDEKAKLGLSFLYDAPPGLKKKEVEDEGEQEVKFEWQRKYNAPREAYAKDDEMIRDQPFGIEVRNVRCIKCRQWGHVNTDKICPLFGKNLTAEPPKPETATSSLLDGLKDDGFKMKKSIMGRLMEGEDEGQVLDSNEDDPEVQFLKSLTPKQKKKLLKQLSKLQSKSGDKVKKAKKDKSKKKKKSKMSESESSDDEHERSRKSDHDHRQYSERGGKHQRTRLNSSDRDVKPKKPKHTSRESERRMERKDKHHKRHDSSSSDGDSRRDDSRSNMKMSDRGRKQIIKREVLSSSSDSSSESENEREKRRRMKKNLSNAYRERRRSSSSEDERKGRRNEEDERRGRNVRERDDRRGDGKKQWNERREREERMQMEEERRERAERREREERRERDERHRNDRRNDSDSDVGDGYDRKKKHIRAYDNGDEFERRERRHEDRRRERSRSRERMERKEERRHRR